MSISENVYNLLKEQTKEAARLSAELATTEEKILSRKYSAEGLRELYEQRDTLRRSLNNLCDYANCEAKKLVSEYQDKLRKEDRLDPAELTDDVRLLSAGIPLLKRDIEAILERNSNNRTMTQLALRYAEEHGLNVGVRYVGKGEVADQAEPLNFTIDTYTGRWMSQSNALAMLDKFFVMK